MTKMTRTIAICLLLGLAPPGWSVPQEAENQGAETPVAGGKPSAPVTLAYTVIGAPVVGQPVSIAIEVISTLQERPVTLHYGIQDAAELAFAQDQPQQVALGTIATREPVRRQVRVVPQREGRLYLNVMAEVETEGGALLKAMAIPIQVGDAPVPRTPQGEVLRDAEGEAVISLPASER